MTSSNNSISTRKTWLGGLSSALAIVALLGTVLTLMGFGVALSLETFGLNPIAVYSSPSDFLVLSSEVFAQVLSGLHTINTNPELHHFWYVVAAPGFSAIILIVYILARWVRNDRSRGVQKFKHEDLPALQRFFARVWARPWIRLPFVALTAWLASAGIFRAVFLILVFLVILPIIPSCVGYELGKNAIAKYVVTPSKCTPLYSQKERVKLARVNQVNSAEEPTAALCFRVIKEGKELGRGRKIERTHDVIFLFKPETGEVLSIPIKDAIVEQIDKL